MKTQAQKAAEFEALHKAPGCFVIPNPWDLGSARVLVQLGFEALATTSCGFAWTLGRRLVHFWRCRVQCGGGDFRRGDMCSAG